MSRVELETIDGLKLPEEHCALLRPGEPVRDERGNIHHLPRFFFSVPSWPAAHAARLAPHFKLSELMTVDCQENDLLLHTFPHYVPCVVMLLARYLEDFRREADAAVFVSANGGYRSPAHHRNRGKSPHCWATAADIYRVGDTYLDGEKALTNMRRSRSRSGRRFS